MRSSHHDSLEIMPTDLKEHPSKQSQHAHVPKVPLRTVLLAQSGSVKTVPLSNLFFEHIKKTLRAHLYPLSFT